MNPLCGIRLTATSKVCFVFFKTFFPLFDRPSIVVLMTLVICDDYHHSNDADDDSSNDDDV